MGALAVPHACAASGPEQSYEPEAGVGVTHEGVGGVWTQPVPASSGTLPTGQTPPSNGGKATHPYAG
jgi:hypothetical protein